MKRLFVLSLLTLSLVAGQYAKLKDGTIIILKDDGTWEKVETIPQGAQVAPEPTLDQPKQAQQIKKPKTDPLAQEYAQKLQGTWENFDGSLKYIVEGDRITFIDGRKKRSGTFTIKSVKPDKREFLLNIGEVGSAGYFSFGGLFRKLAFSPDYRTLTDYSASMPTELRKVR